MKIVLSRIEEKFRVSINTTSSDQKDTQLYFRLYLCLKELILANEIPELSLLPATRQLAEKLNVSRSTVNKSYELIRLEGFIEAKAGSGHVVKVIGKSDLKFNKETPSSHEYPKLSEIAKSFSGNISLINSTDDKDIAFRPGLPPLDIFPVNQWKNLMNLYWRNIKFSDLSYSPSSGIDQLKQNISSYLNLSRGIKCDYRQIVIVSGSLQSLYLLGSIILNPGDSVLVENPTFPNVHSIFKGLRANIQSTRLDDQGMDLSFLEDLGNSPKLIHTTPSCHYPTGTVMSMERKLELLKWASNRGSIIIENDYEHQIHNYYKNGETLYSLDKEHRTVFLGTFNRILHPSIRIGYIVLPSYLIDPVDALLKHSHRFVPPSIQIVLNEFIEKNYLNNHIKKLVEVAEERSALFQKVFDEQFSSEIVLSKSEVPSLHMLARIPNTQNDSLFVKELAINNIVSHSFSKCFVDSEKEQGLILGYSSVIGSQMKRKLKKMGAIYKTVPR